MIRVLHLQGNAHSLGRQHGEQVADLRPIILGTMQARLRKLRSQIGDFAGAVREVEQAWEEHVPATLDMLKGIAGALGLKWGIFLPLPTHSTWNVTGG